MSSVSPRSAARRALASVPADPQALWGLAQTYEGTLVTQAIAEAQVWLRRIVQTVPGWYEPQFRLALMLSVSGHGPEVARAFRRSIALKPADASPLNCLSRIAIEHEDVPTATTWLGRAVTVEPRFREGVDELTRLRTIKKQDAPKRRIARYPASQDEFADLRNLIKRRVLGRRDDKFLRRDSRVVAFGSCFAANIVEALRHQQVDAWHVGHPEEINSPYANRHLLEWVETGSVTPSTEAFGTVLDRGNVLERLRRANVVILSLGVAPAFFDKQTGAFVSTLGSHMSVSLMMSRFNFRTPSVAENVDCVERIMSTIRRIAPDSRIVLTVSPVPLTATLEMDSAVEADCLSKSTLRVTVNEVMQRNPKDVYYWPSFEMVRWIVGGHIGQVFGTDDGSPFHVSSAVVDTIMGLFIETHGADFMPTSKRDQP